MRVVKENKEMLLSVIIPVYNAENFLCRCLDSILNQKNVRLEVILVDDGSTDRSGAICDDYAERDERITVIHQKNGGASNARNHGLRIAKGDYIGFVDADDWIAEDMYCYLADLIRNYSADVAVCDYVATKRKGKCEKQKETIIIRRGEELKRFFFRLDGGKSFFSVWNGLYKREVLEDIRFLEGQINEDVYFTYEVYKKADQIVFSNLKKYFYFVNSHSVTNSRVCRRDYSQFAVWDRIIEDEKNTDYSDAAVFNRKRATFNLYMKAKLYGISDDMRKDTMKNWKKELKQNYVLLMKSKALDWKRKCVLFCICRLNY